MEKKKKIDRWIALTAMGLGVFMGLLDVTVVNVALPTMARGFKTTFTDLQWVLNAYTLVYAVTLMIMSKLGDMYGRKKISWDHSSYSSLHRQSTEWPPAYSSSTLAVGFRQLVVPV